MLVCVCVWHSHLVNVMAQQQAGRHKCIHKNHLHIVHACNFEKYYTNKFFKKALYFSELKPFAERGRACTKQFRLNDKAIFFYAILKKRIFFPSFFLVVHFIFILYSLAIHGYILIEKYPNRMTFNAKKHHVNDERWIVKCCQHKHSVSINKRKTICVVMAEGANKKETMNTNIIEVEPSMVVTTIWLRVHFGSVAHTLIYVLAETCSTVKKMCHVSLFFALFNRFGNKIDR